MSDKTFYKFKNIDDYCIDSLKNKYFYFSTPEKLNAPEDCQLPLEYEAEDKKILEWIKHEKKLSKIMHMSPYPFDTVAKVHKGIQDGIIQEIFMKTCKNVSNQFHLFSLTDSFEYSYMWDHEDYCLNFTGMCIGYKSYQLQKPTYNTYFIECNKNDPNRKPYIIEFNGKYYYILKKVEYDNDRLHSYNPFEEKYDKNDMLVIESENSNKKNIEYNLFHKTSKWDKEHEYRGFYINVNSDDSKVYYPDEVIEDITFGYNVTEKKRNEIMQIIKDNYSNYNIISFYEAKEENGVIIRTPIKKYKLQVQ